MCVVSVAGGVRKERAASLLWWPAARAASQAGGFPPSASLSFSVHLFAPPTMPTLTYGDVSINPADTALLEAGAWLNDQVSGEDVESKKREREKTRSLSLLVSQPLQPLASFTYHSSSISTRKPCAACTRAWPSWTHPLPI